MKTRESGVQNLQPWPSSWGTHRHSDTGAHLLPMHSKEQAGRGVRPQLQRGRWRHHGWELPPVGFMAGLADEFIPGNGKTRVPLAPGTQTWSFLPPGLSPVLLA